MDLFDQQDAKNDNRPLADRMRPRSLDEYVGQGHLLGADSLLRRAVQEDRLFSVIFWGPPGSGKTTLARILAGETKSHFIGFSAVLSGVKEIRAVVDEAAELWRLHRRPTILFVDEIHRFNKAQQDAFLPHVESGLITLIGATTENPSFEVISPLLSRMRVLTLKPFTEEDLARIVRNALADRERGFGALGLEIEPEALTHIVWSADGDARAALNSLEAAVSLADKAEESGRRVTRAFVEEAIQKKALQYDKSGEEHYNIISALHKSLRGSDPDAALYWLGRMLMAGEDPLYIARRLDPLCLRGRRERRPARADRGHRRHAGLPFPRLPRRGAGPRPGDGLPRHRPEEQRPLCRLRPGPGDDREDGDPARSAPYPERSDETDEGAGLRQGVPLRPRFYRRLYPAGIPAG